MLRLRDLDAWGRWNSLVSFARDGVDEAFSFRDSVGDRSPDDRLGGDFCPLAAAAAACCARSFREAFPRFLRSLIYSHPKPNSVARQYRCPTKFLAETHQRSAHRGSGHRTSSGAGCTGRRLC